MLGSDGEHAFGRHGDIPFGINLFRSGSFCERIGVEEDSGRIPGPLREFSDFGGGGISRSAGGFSRSIRPYEIRNSARLSCDIFGC